MQQDSVDKIIGRYFAAVARHPFTFKGVRYEPKPLKVSPLLLRDYTCPPGCGGCCFKFTLDYLPSEEKPPGVRRRTVTFDGREIQIWTDPQKGNGYAHCQHLQDSGRCGIYSVRPFTCDFELIRTLAFEQEERPNVLTQKLFGRGWSYKRTDGGKGAKCEMLPVSDKAIQEVVRKLGRLRLWTDHFGLVTWIPDILQAIERGSLQKGSLTFNPQPAQGFGL